MFYNQVVGLRAVGRSEKTGREREQICSNMSAIICSMGETGLLTNLPKSGGGLIPPDSDSPRTAFYCFLLWRDHQLTF
jgi:hypothetical protein